MADNTSELTALTADIVSAYVTNNEVVANELGSLISNVHAALGSAGVPEEPPPPDHKVDKAAIRKSLSDDHLTSFIDGRKYKSLKRHLGVAGLTPDDYRAKFGLPKDYPMVAPAYSAQRSSLAKSLGLGRKAAAPEPVPAADPDHPFPTAKGKVPAKAKGKPGLKGKAKAIDPSEEPKG